MTEKVTPLALFGGPLERLTPLGEEYERAARKALNPLIERAQKEGVKLRELGYILHSLVDGLIINGVLQRGVDALRAKKARETGDRPVEKPVPWGHQAGTRGPDAPGAFEQDFTLRERAARAERALAVHMNDDVEQATRDLLGDLMHLANREALEFDELLASGRANYQKEINGE